MTHKENNTLRRLSENASAVTVVTYLSSSIKDTQGLLQGPAEPLLRNETTP